MLQNRLFFALVSRSGFGATISDAVTPYSFVFYNSIAVDRIVMATSRLFRVAAFVILLSFAAGSGKLYWSGCMKAANDSDLSADFLHFVALVFFCSTWGVKSAV